ncbi:DNA polymerase ligase N-terminal domain-containing protein [Streptomyces phyllanthi]|uniref:3'-phosphoesterase n=1 Tax=Streptomyces phyllanthi TaxID=1803180 RepID=A0A5N8W9C7_9ACTN|nr:DNA polymerase ligase N-terminal domain-containing protein [Streptomyces phyllanthi]MPY42924.1 3'-phosphoesterase [Streptomyces phyllanthi]
MGHNAEHEAGDDAGGSDRLRKYRGKRDFDRTREPHGRGGEGEARAGAETEDPHFVIQIHDARTMHFDFRLQVDDVLKSWSVPKGPSTAPRDKRLAIPTEDHPLEYEEFEGVIPAGEYGGGTVIVWDHGTYQPLSHDRKGRPVPFEEALERGHATFRLNGSKLRGEYALTRFRSGEEDGEEAWLLVKAGKSGKQHNDETGTGTPDPRRARSVRSGRTLSQVAADVREG